MAKARKTKKQVDLTPEATVFSPFPAPSSPSGIYPMTPPVWPDPGLGFDLGGMASQEERDRQEI